MRNFAYPYFSRDIAEFWRRWHISLSTWFRDYLYIPLGGSRSNAIRNVFIIFIISGFWHGANWTFLVWGALNAIYFLPLLLRKKNRKNLDIVARGRLWPSMNELFSMLLTFGITTLAWIFFRSESINHAISYLLEIFSTSLFNYPEVRPRNTIILIALFLIIEWVQREEAHPLQWDRWIIPRPIKWAIKLIMIEVIILEMTSSQSQQFIYFNF